MRNPNRAAPRFQDLDPVSQRLVVEAVVARARRMRAEAMRNLLRRGAAFIYHAIAGTAQRITSVTHQRSREMRL